MYSKLGLLRLKMSEYYNKLIIQTENLVVKNV